MSLRLNVSKSTPTNEGNRDKKKRDRTSGSFNLRNSAKKSKIGTTSDIKATTFGVEFEFNLVFHEDQLRQILKDYNIDANIIKKVTDPRTHDVLLGTDWVVPVASHQGRARWPSWALEVPRDDVTFARERMIYRRTQGRGERCTRPYMMEPLLLAHKYLQQTGLPCNVIGGIEPFVPDPTRTKVVFPGQDDAILVRSDQVDYTKWTLTDDYTLIGSLPSQIADHLEKRGIPEPQHWDSHGIELISPIFDLAQKADSFVQIGEYLSALKRGPKWDILDSVWASTHVHIGFNFDKPEDAPILLLQHIAYILILHEDLISQCHPRSRCGLEVAPTDWEDPALEPDFELPVEGDGAEKGDFNPEAPWEGSLPPTASPTPSELAAEAAADDLRVLQREAKYTGYGNVNSNAQYMAQSHGHSHPMAPTTVRDLIFQETGSILDLIQLLQRPTTTTTVTKVESSSNFMFSSSTNDGFRDRAYMVNWANMEALARGHTTWKPIKPTIEFRQHAACAADTPEPGKTIGRWVTILEALMNAAKRMADLKIDGEEAGQVALIDDGMSYAAREGRKYCDFGVGGGDDENGLRWPYNDMEEFCREFLQLGGEDVAYWKSRHDRYKDDRP